MDSWLYVDTEPPRTCKKCGNNIVGPGRLAMKLPHRDPVFYCDCITEEEICKIALEFDAAIRDDPEEPDA